MNNHHQEHHDHHAMMVQDFKRRFFISSALTIPILLLSPMIQSFMRVDWTFPGSLYILFALSTVLFFFGGKPFLTGAWDEMKERSPAMMSLIAFAITSTALQLRSSLEDMIFSGSWQPWSSSCS